VLAAQHGEEWGELFAQIMQNVLNDLEGGERQRLLGVRAPGVAASSWGRSSIGTPKRSSIDNEQLIITVVMVRLRSMNYHRGNGAPCEW